MYMAAKMSQMKRQMPKVTEGVKALFVLPLTTFYFTQSHGLKSAYLNLVGYLQEVHMFRRIFGLERQAFKHAQKGYIFYFHNIVTLDFATKTFNMRYEGNLSKDYNLLKSHFMQKTMFYSPIDSTCGRCLIVQKKKILKQKIKTKRKYKMPFSLPSQK